METVLPLVPVLEVANLRALHHDKLDLGTGARALPLVLSALRVAYCLWVLPGGPAGIFLDAIPARVNMAKWLNWPD